MSILSVIVVVLCSWWMIFFMVLPFGVRHDDPEIPGHQSGAPDRPMLKKKILITTLLSIVISGIILYVISSSDLSFRILARYWE